ncbi:MAG: aspartyl/glutamyl-tRNA amidotransferase subunit C [Spirochaetaceae bacterium]|jgi:Asp-tRNA(Asn)/Glu-tRNA(Gln) amidotransferase C subunit|nr:aspartyl/glutamyl-tRNA amidotransferase subunit C [Spirochaetaceae bacterium]
MSLLGMDSEKSGESNTAAGGPGAGTPLEISGDLRITASLAHLDVDEAELEAALPAFREMLSYFATMQAADNDEKVFGGGISGFSFAGESVDSAHFRADAALTPAAKLADLMLDNSGERDSRFIVVPNVL